MRKGIGIVTGIMMLVVELLSPIVYGNVIVGEALDTDSKSTTIVSAIDETNAEEAEEKQEVETSSEKDEGVEEKEEIKGEEKEEAKFSSEPSEGETEVKTEKTEATNSAEGNSEKEPAESLGGNEGETNDGDTGVITCPDGSPLAIKDTKGWDKSDLEVIANRLGIDFEKEKEVYAKKAGIENYNAADPAHNLKIKDYLIEHAVEISCGSSKGVSLEVEANMVDVLPVSRIGGEDRSAEGETDSVAVTTPESCFNFSNGTITGYNKSESCGADVIIPKTIGGVAVTSIEERAFYSNQLTSVEIPDGVTSIGSHAFYSNQLESVVIGTGVTEIGDSAFAQNKLTNVVIPDGVTSIGEGAFSQNQLTSVEIPDSVTSIGLVAFYSNQLESAVIGTGVTEIGEQAFVQNKLTNVVIPDGVTSIGAAAFASNKLTNVVIPDGVTSIGLGAFYSNQLTSVEIPDSVTSIGRSTFCENATNPIKAILTSPAKENIDYTDSCLKPEPGYIITFKLNPGDINLTVKKKGSEKKLSPMKDVSFYLVEGEYTYKVEKEGYETKEGTFTVTKDETIEITLKKKETSEKPKAEKKVGYSGGGGAVISSYVSEESRIANDTTEKEHFSAQVENKEKLSVPIINDSYLYAYEKGITTMPTREKAELDRGITRAELAKMISVFAMKVGGEKLKKDNIPVYADKGNIAKDLQEYVKLAYQLQLMGIDAYGNALNKFEPNKRVTKGEVATVISRVLFGLKYNQDGENWYALHLNILLRSSLMEAGNHNDVETRGEVMELLHTLDSVVKTLQKNVNS